MKYKRPLDDIPFLADVCVLRTVTGVGVKNALTGVILVQNIRGEGSLRWNLRLRSLLVRDLSSVTNCPKYQNFPGQITMFET